MAQMNNMSLNSKLEFHFIHIGNKHDEAQTAFRAQIYSVLLNSSSEYMKTSQVYLVAAHYKTSYAEC